MTSFSNLILVYDKEKQRFCWKILLYHYSQHPWEYFTQKKCAHIPWNLIVSIGREYTADPVGRNVNLMPWKGHAHMHKFNYQRTISRIMFSNV